VVTKVYKSKQTQFKNPYFCFCFVLVWLSLMLSTIDGFGQTVSSGRDLRSCAPILDSVFSDSLKSLIRVTADEKLTDLRYPYSERFKVIHDWTYYNNNSKIYRHLSSKGVYAYQETVILIAFKRYLNKEAIDEKKLLMPYQKIEKKWLLQSKVRYTTDTIKGVYIPKDLEDCFKQIDSFLNDSTKKKIKAMAEKEFSSSVHMGFGLGIRNDWQLWSGSRLSKYFNNIGIQHPDDMSGIIFNSYHRYLTNKDIELDKQVAFYKAYWENALKRQFEKDKNDFSMFKIGDTVFYKYPYGFTTSSQKDKYIKRACVSKGLVIEKNQERLSLKVKLLESCDSKGIFWYHNRNSLGLKGINLGNKNYSNKGKKLVKNNQSRDFRFSDWGLSISPPYKNRLLK